MIDYLEDLESDFSVFHRVDDIYSMDSVTFCRRAFRLAAYDGVIAARIYQLQKQEQQMTPQVTAGAKTVESNQATLATSDIGELFSFGKGG